MTTRSSQLTELLDELHAVNQDLAKAARPLQWLSDLDLEERQHLADQIRAGLSRWEQVNQRICRVLHDSSGNPEDGQARYIAASPN